MQYWLEFWDIPWICYPTQGSKHYSTVERRNPPGRLKRPLASSSTSRRHSMAAPRASSPICIGRLPKSCYFWLKNCEVLWVFRGIPTSDIGTACSGGWKTLLRTFEVFGISEYLLISRRILLLVKNTLVLTWRRIRFWTLDGIIVQSLQHNCVIAWGRFLQLCQGYLWFWRETKSGDCRIRVRYLRGHKRRNV